MYGNWMFRGQRRSAAVWTGICRAAVLFVSAIGSAFAVDGYSQVVTCASCSNSSSFVSAGLAAARSAVQPGLFIVLSASAPRAAYVRVTGTVGRVCDREGACEQVLKNAAGIAVDANGSAISTDTAFEQIDASIFGTNRKAPLTQLAVDANEASSFINSDDSYVIQAINSALGRKGINPNAFKTGDVITVVFADGTKAIYMKTTPISAVNWQWTGIAYNASGDRIGRNGAVVPNPNTRGDTRGSFGDGGLYGGTRFNFEFRGGSLCSSSTTVAIDGVVVSSWRGFTLC